MTNGYGMADHRYFVYIMSNHLRSVLYIGVSNNLERRVMEHKSGSFEGFSKQYGLHNLVYFEEYPYVDQAIAREKQLKGWRRDRKEALIHGMNPERFDLAADWYK